MIFTSKVDKNKYHALDLINNLKVLLISNPEYTKSSCALSVRVGSLDEPNEFPGLAHFLEHMLFLGTEKYPNESDFDEFLSVHGGHSNAYTDSEATVYYFDVDSNYIEGAADRFSQFFTSPLIAKESVNREINAVNSEFLSSLNHKGWRQQRILQDLMLETRDEHRFNCGNLETLQKDNILEEVRKFEKKFYSSDLMCLVICSNKSLEELEVLAKLFSNIKNIHRKMEVDARKIDEPKIMFKDEYYSKIVQYAPLDDKKEIIINFILPRLRESYEKNPLDYIEFMISSNEPTGLISTIIKSKLGFELSFSYDHYLEYTQASISIELTDLGCKEHKKVVDLVYSFISTLPVNEAEYNRLKRIRKEEFDYIQLEAGSDLASSLCVDLHYYPVENILNHPYLFSSFDADLINNIVKKMLDTSKWIILLADKNGSFDRSEYFYKVEYGVVADYTPTFMNIFKSKRETEDKFIDNVNLLEKDPKRSYKSAKYENGEIHYVFDCKFNVPKTNIIIDLNGSEIEREFLSTKLFFALAEEKFIELKERELCNYHLDMSINTTSVGIKITFTGFSSKIIAVATEFFDTLKKCSLDNFEVIRKEAENLFSDNINKNPSRRTVEVFRSKFFLQKSNEELLDEVKLIKKEEVALPSNFYIKILAVGNILWEEVESFFNTIKGTGKASDTVVGNLKSEYKFKTIDKFNNGLSMFFRINSLTQVSEPEINYETESIALPETPCVYHYKSAVGNLLYQISHEHFYAQLRTAEQLGYVVSCAVGTYSSAEYLIFTVQSEKEVSFLEKRINEFVVFIKELINNMEDAEFITFKESLVSTYEEPFANLNELNRFCYTQTHTGCIDLNIGKKMALLVMSLTKEDLLKSDVFDSYVKVFSEKNFK